MSTKMTIGAGLAAICLVLPGLSHAQPYSYYGRDYRPQAYGDSYRRPVRGYPEFQSREYRIQRLIEDGVRDDLIERDDARDLIGQLRSIQQDERREFAVHGPNLPEDDRERISDRLSRLDRLVDQIRDEE